MIVEQLVDVMRRFFRDDGSSRRPSAEDTTAEQFAAMQANTREQMDTFVDDVLRKPVHPTEQVDATGHTADVVSPLIVFVDDDVVMSVLAPALARSVGYRSEVYSDGVHAYARLCDASRERPLLVLSDVHMPLMDGRELFRKIRQHASLNDVSLALMTASIDTDGLADQTLVEAILRKPLTGDSLRALVKQVERKSSSDS